MSIVRQLLSGLRGKLLVLAGVPFIIFQIIGYMRVQDYNHQLKEVHNVSRNMKLVQASSELVTQLQRERGKSATYVSGSLQLPDVESQRVQTNAALKNYQEAFQNASLDQETQKRATTAISTLDQVRQSVNQKEPKSKVVPGFSSLILEMLWLQIAASQGLSNVEGLMRISLLEAAKESMGKLRATVSPILATDGPIGVDDIRVIVDLKSAAEVGLNAPALVSSKVTYEKIKAFRTGAEWGKVSTIVKKVIDRASQGKYEEDSKSYFDTITQAIDQVGAVIGSEFESTFKVIKSEEEKASANLMYMWITMGVVTLVVVGVLYLVMRAITKPIHAIITELQSGSISVSQTSDQISKASEQLSSASTEAAASFEETVASIEEVSQMVKITAEKTTETAKLTTTSQAAAKKGEQQIQDLINSMKDLETSSRKMEEIINVIDDIAFQTNLLALNAAVEAARAGEQGKGFAVVAEAVRNLAGRSASAAKDISSLIQESVGKIGHGAKSADDSYTVLIEMVKSFTRVTENISEITKASREQQAGIEQIGKAMNQLDQVTQSNAATAEESSASATEMADQAAMLNNIVTQLVKVVEG